MRARGIALMCMQDTKVRQTTQYVVGYLVYATHGRGGSRPISGWVGMVFRRDPGGVSQALSCTKEPNIGGRRGPGAQAAAGQRRAWHPPATPTKMGTSRAGPVGVPR